MVVACLQETGDGELVVLHDLHSVLAASQQYEVNKGIMAELARAGLQPEAPATSTLVSKCFARMLLLVCSSVQRYLWQTLHCSDRLALHPNWSCLHLHIYAESSMNSSRFKRLLDTMYRALQ